MSLARTETESSVAEEVFELLKRRGPLCTSQLSVELLLGMKTVQAALEELQAMGVVAPRPDRPDRNDDLNRLAEEIPWGLRRSFK